MFWTLLIVAMFGLSILALNPIPIIACIVVWAVAQPGERLQRPIVEAAGRNADAPPRPTSGIGALGCLMWALCMGAVGFLVLVVIAGILEGGA